MRRAAQAVVALAGIAAIAVGVVEVTRHSHGGPTISTTTTRAPLGRRAFIRRADAICAILNPEIEADYRIALADGEAGDVTGAQVQVARLQAAASRLIARIEGLGPPAEGAADVSTLLTEYQQLVADAVANTPESNASAVALQSQIAAQAAQYGFHVCGIT